MLNFSSKSARKELWGNFESNFESNFSRLIYSKRATTPRADIAGSKDGVDTARSPARLVPETEAPP